MNLKGWDLSPAIFEPKPKSETHFKTEEKPFGNSERGEGKLGCAGSSSLPSLYFPHFPLQRKNDVPGALGALGDEGFMSFSPSHVSKINKG